MAFVPYQLSPVAPIDMPPAGKLFAIGPGTPPRAPRRGFLGGLGDALGGENAGRNLMVLGAGLRDLGTGGDSLPEVVQQLDQQRLQQAAMVWQRMQQGRQQMEWKAQDQQTRAAGDYVNTLPAEQQPLARANPMAAVSSALTANAQANQPLTPYQRITTSEDHRHNVAMENKPSGGMGASGPIDPDTVNYYAQMSVNQGGRLPQGISTRSALGQSIMAAMPAEARRRGVDPQNLSTVALAYQGDVHSYQHLKQTRDQVVAFERTADNFLTNLQQLQSRLPSDQISRVPAANTALQAMNAQLRGQGPLGAYVGALVSARAEISRVLSGSNSPTVESMHEAERLLPNNITPQAMAAVSANIHNEMRLRSGAIDSTLSDIQDRVRAGELPATMLDEHNTSTVGGATNQLAPVIRYDAQGRRIP